jgi:hypothetical protein
MSTIFDVTSIVMRAFPDLSSHSEFINIFVFVKQASNILERPHTTVASLNHASGIVCLCVAVKATRS